MLIDPIEELYKTKENNYFSLEREIFKNAIKQKGIRILDIGCGTGALGAFFRKEQQCEVYGIDINKNACLEAEKNIDHVLHANVETIDLPYESDYFDVVVMGDVLEHLLNPVIAIHKILGVLKPGGHIYITVPNVRHWQTTRDLVFKDKWEYASWGTLDYTHLRFFTRTSIIKMFSEAGINVIKTEWVIKRPSKSSRINTFSFGLFAGFLASHTFLVVKKE